MGIFGRAAYGVGAVSTAAFAGGTFAIGETAIQVCNDFKKCVEEKAAGKLINADTVCAAYDKVISTIDEPEKMVHDMFCNKISYQSQQSICIAVGAVFAISALYLAYRAVECGCCCNGKKVSVEKKNQ